MNNKIMELADAYADAMEKGPFSRSYRGNIQDTRIALNAEIDRVVAEHDAQRKVLEMALEALQAALSDDQQYLDPCEKAITAIQGVLK